MVWAMDGMSIPIPKATVANRTLSRLLVSLNSARILSFKAAGVGPTNTSPIPAMHAHITEINDMLQVYKRMHERLCYYIII